MSMRGVWLEWEGGRGSVCVQQEVVMLMVYESYVGERSWEVKIKVIVYVSVME